MYNIYIYICHFCSLGSERHQTSQGRFDVGADAACHYSWLTRIQMRSSLDDCGKACRSLTPSEELSAEDCCFGYSGMVIGCAHGIGTWHTIHLADGAEMFTTFRCHDQRHPGGMRARIGVLFRPGAAPTVIEHVV